MVIPRALKVLLVLFIGSTVSDYARSATTVDLAKKCRDMMTKAYPKRPAGVPGNALEQRQFFAKCVAQQGKMDNSDINTVVPPQIRPQQ
jgi:hypothetical protein